MTFVIDSLSDGGTATFSYVTSANVATDGNDFLVGNGDNGVGGSLDDSIDGGLGNDQIRGYAGDDTLLGGDGNDTLDGGSGSDTLNGGAGNDILGGGAGEDFLSGGGGGDTFAYSATTDGVQVADGVSGSQDGDDILDAFLSGTDRFEFLNSAFGLGDFEGNLTTNTNFFSVSTTYNGTNAGAASGTDYFVFDTTKSTLYYDDDSSTDGYTVLATLTNGGSVAASDIFMVANLGDSSAA